MKSLITKFIAAYVIFSGLLFGIIYFFKFENSLWIFALALFVFVTAIIFLFIIRPIRAVLYQMQLVLGGKKFKKIYTKRVDEVGILAHFFNQVMEGFKEVASDIKDRKRILDELTVATELQKQLFPAEIPSFDDLNVTVKNRPATELGGDSYDFVETKDRIYFYVGDVTGHGTTAALIMSMVNAMIDTFAGLLNSAYEIIVNTNKDLRKHIKTSMYMTLVMLCWDKNAKKMTYVGAGHEHILVYRKATGQIDDIVSGGTALGMVEDVSATTKEQEIVTGKGDIVVLYSDGITEAKNTSGELYGIERLKKALAEYGSQYSSSGVCHHISQDLAAFVGDESQIDDMTLMAIEKK
jgi:sigma-B regulation protein RsbU (phosphoserine phosphatase)